MARARSGASARADAALGRRATTARSTVLREPHEKRLRRLRARTRRRADDAARIAPASRAATRSPRTARPRSSSARPANASTTRPALPSAADNRVRQAGVQFGARTVDATRSAARRRDATRALRRQHGAAAHAQHRQPAPGAGSARTAARLGRLQADAAQRRQQRLRQRRHRAARARPAVAADAGKLSAQWASGFSAPSFVDQAFAEPGDRAARRAFAPGRAGAAVERGRQRCCAPRCSCSASATASRFDPVTFETLNIARAREPRPRADGAVAAAVRHERAARRRPDAAGPARRRQRHAAETALEAVAGVELQHTHRWVAAAGGAAAHRRAPRHRPGELRRRRQPGAHDARPQCVSAP